MKKFKTFAMISAAIMVGSMTVTAMAANNIKSKNKAQTATIGAEKAKKIALEQAGLKEANVTFEKAQLEYDDNVAVYDVEFHTDNTEYEYEINAVSGTVMESHKENRKNQSSGNQVSTNQTSNNQSAANQKEVITSDKAKEIVLAHAGLTPAEVTFEEVKLDREDGVTVYEIEFHHNRTEHNYELNAVDGTIIEFNVDND